MKLSRLVPLTALLVALAGCQKAAPPSPETDRENWQKPSSSTPTNGAPAPH
ncbi:MAG: hypothetical protein ACO1SV_01750 [Fimbriimonas sp.]